MPKGIPIPNITKIQLFSHISCVVASKVGRLMRLSNVEQNNFRNFAIGK